MIFEGFEDGATGFVDVHAVIKAAVVGDFEDVTEVVGDFFGFHIEGAKSLNAGNVDDASAKGEVAEFAEGSRVHPCTMGVGDCGSLYIRSGDKYVH